ncbi:MAG: hypothetical protein IPK78_20070 [Rhodospirillales bacterium]|nr:hypothetical protein [Rhodospirillales bacterium]
MARTEAVGDEPIVFFTGDGRQIFLPVDDIFFDGAAVGSKTEPSSPSDPLGKWLKYLVAQGRLPPPLLWRPARRWSSPPWAPARPATTSW